MDAMDVGSMEPRRSESEAGARKRETNGPRSESTTATAAGAPVTIEQLGRALREFDGEPASTAQGRDAHKSRGLATGSVPDSVNEDKVLSHLLKNAGILITAREHRLASNILRSALMRDPNHAQALMQMGVCHRETGRFDEALKCFRALVKTSHSVEAQLLVAETFYLAERDEMALAVYRDVLKNNVVVDKSKLFDTYKNVGNIHVRAGDFEAAEEYYDKAYTLDSNSDVLMVNYGTLEIQRENLGAAVERFRQAVAINGANDKAWVGLAIVHRQMGDQELAWANAERALDINPINRSALRFVVEWGVADHRFSPVITRLQNYLAQDGEDGEMSFSLAKVLTQSGRLTEARLEMERVMALDPAMEGADRLVRALDREIARRNGAAVEKS